MKSSDLPEFTVISIDWSFHPETGDPINKDFRAAWMDDIVVKFGNFWEPIGIETYWYDSDQIDKYGTFRVLATP